MIDQITLSQKEDYNYQFDNFEFVVNGDEHGDQYYILCEEGYFAIDSLENFLFHDNNYIIINEDDDKFEISIEDFEKIKGIMFNV